MLTLNQCTKEVGRNRSSLLRAIQKGRLSAKRGEDGQWWVDPAELFRVYQPAPIEQVHTHAHTNGDADTQNIECRLLRELLDEKDKRIAEQATMIEGLENLIADLQARLDFERAECQQLTRALLPPPRASRWRLW